VINLASVLEIKKKEKKCCGSLFENDIVLIFHNKKKIIL